MVGKARQQAQSRATVNKTVRRILLRYKVCLINLRFSTTSKTIFLKGYLIKNNGSDLNANLVRNMVAELSKVGFIRAELENWAISHDSVNFLGGDYSDLDFDEVA
ncbi:MAG: hypothetical protein CME65_04280 [Halobacteriovoraceae bacterium]|nr:hypothetical protein [Halobacteriovoraceae bacterium]|tara:strand:- start:7807 stop:8121 length:315 start_codon:yes stop_codon:yes gene_type:complete